MKYAVIGPLRLHAAISVTLMALCLPAPFLLAQQPIAASSGGTTINASSSAVNKPALPAGSLLIGALNRPPNAQNKNPRNQGRLAERSEYRLALKDLQRNRISAFKRRQKALEGYVLAPYLEYHYLNSRVSSLTAEQINTFEARYSDFPFAALLRDRWLLRLPGQGRWLDYLTYYQPSTSATRRCYYLRALYRSGQKKRAL